MAVWVNNGPSPTTPTTSNNATAASQIAKTVFQVVKLATSSVWTASHVR